MVFGSIVSRVFTFVIVAREVQGIQGGIVAAR